MQTFPPPSLSFKVLFRFTEKFPSFVSANVMGGEQKGISLLPQAAAFGVQNPYTI